MGFGKQRQVINLARETTKYRFIVSSPWDSIPIKANYKAVYLRACKGPPYSQGGTGKNGFRSDRRLTASGTLNKAVLNLNGTNKIHLVDDYKGPTARHWC